MPSDKLADQILSGTPYGWAGPNVPRLTRGGNGLPMHDPEGLPDIEWAKRRAGAERPTSAKDKALEDHARYMGKWLEDSFDPLGAFQRARRYADDPEHPITKQDQSDWKAAANLATGLALSPVSAVGLGKLAPVLSPGAPTMSFLSRYMRSILGALPIGSSGVSNRLPAMLDAEVTGYNAAREAYARAAAEYPNRFNSYLQADRMLNPKPPMQGGLRDPNGRAVRSREGERLVRALQAMPQPQPPARPAFAENLNRVTGPFGRSNPHMGANADATIDEMLGAINQSPTIPTAVAGTVLGGGGLYGAMHPQGEPQDKRFNKPMKLGPTGPTNIEKDLSDELRKKAEEKVAAQSTPEDKERWYLDQPEARDYNYRASIDRGARNLAYGLSGALGTGAVMTTPWAFRHADPSPWMTGLGMATDNPALMLLGLGTLAVPAGLGLGSIASLAVGNKLHNNAKLKERLLDANYSRKHPPMSQEPAVDDWTGRYDPGPPIDAFGDIPEPPRKASGGKDQWGKPSETRAAGRDAELAERMRQHAIEKRLGLVTNWSGPVSIFGPHPEPDDAKRAQAVHDYLTAGGAGNAPY